MVCQVIANENLHLLFADVKAAFAQSDKLARPRGRLFVEPCDGVPVEKGDLIELVQPVYGLDDAPLRWFETVTRFLRSMGLRKSLLDPCVYVQHNEHNELVLLILIEVDDFIVAAKDEKIQQEAKDKLMSRFRFGKWEVGEAGFIGRHIKKEGNEIRMGTRRSTSLRRWRRSTFPRAGDPTRMHLFRRRSSRTSEACSTERAGWRIRLGQKPREWYPSSQAGSTRRTSMT